MCTDYDFFCLGHLFHLNIAHFMWYYIFFTIEEYTHYVSCNIQYLCYVIFHYELTFLFTHWWAYHVISMKFLFEEILNHAF